MGFNTRQQSFIPISNKAFAYIGIHSMITAFSVQSCAPTSPPYQLWTHIRRKAVQWAPRKSSIRHICFTYREAETTVVRFGISPVLWLSVGVRLGHDAVPSKEGHWTVTKVVQDARGDNWMESRRCEGVRGWIKEGHRVTTGGSWEVLLVSALV